MSHVSFVAVVPARYGSRPLPRKALALIGGKPMVVRGAERARESGARDVLVATDSVEIERAVQDHGFRAVMTRGDPASGTDRVAEVVELLGLAPETGVVNGQGDEPLIEPGLIRAVAGRLGDAPE